MRIFRSALICAMVVPALAAVARECESAPAAGEPQARLAGVTEKTAEVGSRQVPVEPVPPPARSDLMPTADAIRLFEARVQANPRDPLSLTVLGQLYLRSAREEDDFGAIGRAVAAFQSALKVRADDVPARLHLASAYAAQHQFEQAARLARDVLKSDESNLLALALLGDAKLEMGDYSEAEHFYRTLLAKRDSAAEVLIRVARLEELQGNIDEAIRQAERAVQLHREAAGSSERLAWYEWRLGQLLFDCGRVDQAAEHFESALAVHPADSHALVGLAAVRVAQGRNDDALRLFERAIAARPEPTTKALLGDLHAKLGNSRQAKRLYDEAEADLQRETSEAVSAAAHGRELARFYCDHDRQLQKALELAKQDCELRQDIYAHDTLAWALYKNGQYEEAAAASEKALRIPTRDARIHHHAGLIWLRAGDQKRGADLLRRALQLNPHFGILEPDRARQVLEQLP